MKDDKGQGSGPGPDELGLWSSNVGMDGHRSWLQQRHDAIRAAGRALGLPLGRLVELELNDGCRMRGVLRLAEEGLFIEASRERPPWLRIDRCTFRLGDIGRCECVE